MIAIIDYGIGNVGSIKNMLQKVGVPSIVTSDIELISQCSGLILPGVGHYDFGMAKLLEYNLIDCLRQKVLVDKVPILGICLGMQLFTKSSEEGSANGLGFLDAVTIKFPHDNRLRVPHMGWNRIKVAPDDVLFHGLPADARFYFVHTYYVHCKNRSHCSAQSQYIIELDAAVRLDNIFGVQFHPEKSHKYGMQVLKNFAGICAAS